MMASCQRLNCFFYFIGHIKPVSVCFCLEVDPYEDGIVDYFILAKNPRQAAGGCFILCCEPRS